MTATMREPASGATDATESAGRGVTVLFDTSVFNPGGTDTRLLGVRLRVHDSVDYYEVGIYPGDMETVVRWAHDSGDPSRCYRVVVGGAGFVPLSCSCKGWTYGGRCRHAEATRALIRCGYITR